MAGVGTYVGAEPRLSGKTAILRPGDPGQVLAQFDDVNLSIGGRLLAYGWHPFAVEDFDITPFDKGD
jgi:hypothetical protein